MENNNPPAADIRATVERLKQIHREIAECGASNCMTCGPLQSELFNAAPALIAALESAWEALETAKEDGREKREATLAWAARVTHQDSDLRMESKRLEAELATARQERDAAREDSARLRKLCVEASITIDGLSPSPNITVKESDRLDRIRDLLRKGAAENA